MVRKVLLICGVLASLLYVGTDMLAAMRYEGYSYTARAVSELFAIGAPTRPLVVPLFLTHGVLQIAFGLGVWMSAGRKRGLRITAGLWPCWPLLCCASERLRLRMNALMSTEPDPLDTEVTR